MSAPNINSEDAKTFKALFSGYSLYSSHIFLSNGFHRNTIEREETTIHAKSP